MTDIAPPRQFAAGDTVRFTYYNSDYPASAGWSLAYRLIGAGINVAIASTAAGDIFTTEALAAATAALTVNAPGMPCTLIGYMTKAPDRFEIYRAPCLVLPNQTTATGDLRGHATKTLAAIEAMIEGRATKDQERYRIGERELWRIPVAELIGFRKYYQGERRREEDAAAVAAGRPVARSIRVQFASRG